MSAVSRAHARIRSLLILLLLVLAPPVGGQRQAPETLRIYLARHGQTDWNLEGRLQGGTDISLNATGRQQALQLGERLKGVHLDGVYSSALSRSRETAQLVAGSSTPTAIARLNERRLGKFEGQKLARGTTGGGGSGGVPSDDPLTREYDTRLLQLKDTLDGGESLEEFAARVKEATTDLLTRHRSGTILIVGHSMTNQMILKALLDLTFEQANGVQMGNDEMYMIEVGGGLAPRLWKGVTLANLTDL